MVVTWALAPWSCCFKRQLPISFEVLFSPSKGILGKPHSTHLKSQAYPSNILQMKLWCYCVTLKNSHLAVLDNTCHFEAQKWSQVAQRRQTCSSHLQPGTLGLGLARWIPSKGAVGAVLSPHCHPLPLNQENSFQHHRCLGISPSLARAVSKAHFWLQVVE